MNKSFELNTFPSSLKKSDVTPAFTGVEPTYKNFSTNKWLIHLIKSIYKTNASQVLPFAKPKFSNLLFGGSREG